MLCKKIIVCSVLLLLVTACTSPMPAPVMNEPSQALIRPPVVNPGAPINLPSAEVPAGYYRVVQGDSIFRIAQRFNVTTASLVSWNNLLDGNQINAGQLLRVVAPTDATSPVAQTSPVLPDGPAQSVHEPIGGVVPYSEQAWAAAPATVVAAPATAESPVTPAAASPPPVVVNNSKSNNAVGVEWSWPAKGNIVAKFGAPSASRGLDIAGLVGSPVLSAADGTVIYAGSGLPGYKNLIIVKHAGDYLSAYAYNKSILVKKGDIVKRGQNIALLGGEGVDKPMLHFEIRRSGSPVDPLKFLPSP